MARGRKEVDAILLSALVCGATLEAAAQKAGISRSTAQRRLRDSAFQQELLRLRSDLVERAAGMLTAASLESVKTLLELQKPAVPHATRLGAARSILEIGVRLRESAELERRLFEVEQRLKLESV